VAEQQLDLFKFAARRAAQLRARPPQVMGRDAGNSNLGRVALEHLPDDLFAEALSVNGSAAIHRPEDVSGGDAGRGCPRINRYLHPRWHRRGPHAAMLSNEIDDAPASVALLDVPKCKRRDFRTSQPASEQNREDGAVAQASDGRIAIPLKPNSNRASQRAAGLLPGGVSRSPDFLRAIAASL
jgi:hypothetical protein